MKTAPPQREKRKSFPSQSFINLVPDMEWLIALNSKLICFICWRELIEELVTEQGLRCCVHFLWPLSTRRGAELGPKRQRDIWAEYSATCVNRVSQKYENVRQPEKSLVTEGWQVLFIFWEL